MFKRGNVWYSDFIHDGKRYTKSWRKLSKSAAQKEDARFQTQVRDGKYKSKAEIKAQAAANPSFTEALDEFMEKKRLEVSARSMDRYEDSAKHLREFFDGYHVDEIENNEILVRKFVEKRKAQIRERQANKEGRTEAELSFSSLNNDRTLLGQMFVWLIEGGRAVRNPIRFIPKQDTAPRIRVLSEEEEDRLLLAIDQLDKRADHVKDIILLALYSGMRRSNFLGVHRDWVKLNEGKMGVIDIPRASLKTKKKDLRIPLNSVTRPIIERRLANVGQSGYLFESKFRTWKGNRRKSQPIRSIQTAWEKVLEVAKIEGRAGVDRVVLHSLRHTFGTRVAKNHDVETVSKLLGHSNISTTLIYMHRDDEQRAEASESICRDRKVPSIVPSPAKLQVVSSES